MTCEPSNDFNVKDANDEQSCDNCKEEFCDKCYDEHHDECFDAFHAMTIGEEDMRWVVIREVKEGEKINKILQKIEKKEISVEEAKRLMTLVIERLKTDDYIESNDQLMTMGKKSMEVAIILEIKEGEKIHKILQKIENQEISIEEAERQMILVIEPIE